MTHEQAKALRANPVFNAMADGKTVQVLDSGTGTWLDVVDIGHYMILEGGVRIKPEARIRPWKPEEVPYNCIIRLKANHRTWFLIAGAINGVLKTTMMTDFDRDFNVETYSPVHDKCEHSTDGGKTWKPCGVEEST